MWPALAGGRAEAEGERLELIQHRPSFRSETSRHADATRPGRPQAAKSPSAHRLSTHSGVATAWLRQGCKCSRIGLLETRRRTLG